MVHYPIRRLKYLLKMKRILEMDYFGLNLKIFKNCLCYRNQCKNLVGVAIFYPQALEERIFLEKRNGHTDQIFRLITMAQTVFKQF